jgi:hypothetical protein
MLIRKAHAGNIPGYAWEEDGQVLDLEDYLAEELLRIPGGGFTLADAPEPEPDQEEVTELLHRPVPEPEPQPKPVTRIPPRSAPKAKGRPRMPRDGQGNIIRDK